jgi:hypothetical protein
VQLCGCSCCWPCVFIPSCAQDAAAAAAAHGIVEVKKKNKKMRFLVSFSNFFSPCVIIVLLFVFLFRPGHFCSSLWSKYFYIYTLFGIWQQVFIGDCKCWRCKWLVLRVCVHSIANASDLYVKSSLLITDSRQVRCCSLLYLSYIPHFLSFFPVSLFYIIFSLFFRRLGAV